MTHSAADQPAQPPRLLLIEDDPDTADLIRVTLCDHFAADCVEHLPRVAPLRERSVDPFDAVLCDYTLPDGTALDALRIVRGQSPDKPFIIVTAQTEIATAVDAINRGATDYVIKTNDLHATIPLTIEKNLAAARMHRENARLRNALAKSLEELRMKNSQLEDAVEKLEEMATTDPLTGLKNRRRLATRLIQMYAEATRYDTDLACVMIDLDGFKGMNDTLGHQRGDEVLVSTGELVAATIRASDVAARYGGDEFVILLPHTNAQTAISLAQRILALFHERCLPEEPEIAALCGMSIGIACLAVSHPESGEQLLNHADKALYAAKEAGRGRIMIYDNGGAAKPVAIAA